MVYVLDATAIVAVAWVASEPDSVFSELVDMVQDGEVCYCDHVVPELERIARREAAHTWAKSNLASVHHRGAPWNYVEWVMHDFADLLDRTVTASQEPAGVYVIAQALDLQRAKREPCVVTEDVKEKPTRASVREACEHFNLPWMSCRDFLDAVGLG